MNHNFVYSVDNVLEEMQKIASLQREYTEQILAEIITKYDFVVGSRECKHRLMSVLPEGASVICSPYIENPTMIYAIKKFDTGDFITPYTMEREDNKCQEQ